MVYVAYITHGYMKHEYNTEMLGVYSEITSKIFHAMYDKLVELEFVADTDGAQDMVNHTYVEEEQEEAQKMYDRIYKNKEFPDNMHDFHQYLKWFNDSYWGEGWDVFVEEFDIQ